MPITLDRRLVTDETPAYVIAEIGHNHQGDLDKAKALILAAHDCGADAVKLQKRDNRTLYTAEEYDAPYNSEHAFGPTYGLHREALEFGLDQYLELKAYAHHVGITLFATAFDRPSLQFLADLDMPILKIGSAQAADPVFVREAAELGVPLVISTGGLTLNQVELAHRAAQGVPHVLLQCTSLYPCEAHQLNLRVIPTFRARFPEVVVGLSNHYPKPNLCIAAYALGARVFEAHFTLNRAWKGTDHAMSLEPDGLRTMVNHLRETWLALGDRHKCLLPEETPALRKMGRRDFS